MGKEVHRRGGNRYVLLKTNPTSTKPLNAMQLQSLMGGSMRVTLFWRREESMTDYLPEVYQQFERRYPRVKEAFDALGAAEHEAGPLGERERRLIKLGIAVGRNRRAVCVCTSASCSALASQRRRSCIPSSSPSPPSVPLPPTRL